MTRQGPIRERTFENIKSFWEAEAAEIGESPQVTIRDFYFRVQELHTLLPLIPKIERLLDIGCGTGFGTMVFSQRAKYTLGIDYSHKMIEWAQKLKTDPLYRETIAKKLSPLWELPASTAHSVEFRQADLTQLHLPSPPFDIIVGERVLINLPTHETQMEVLRNLRKHASENGLLFLVEPTLQGYKVTDDYRAIFGLPPLEKYWHNCYLDETRMEDWEKTGWRVRWTVKFNTYSLLSKVVYPAACGQENCEFLSGANAAAMEIASVFRSKKAVEEMGEQTFFEFYVERVRRYDSQAAAKIESWLEKNSSKLPDWSMLGNQKLIAARSNS